MNRPRTVCKFHDNIEDFLPFSVSGKFTLSPIYDVCGNAASRAEHIVTLQSVSQVVNPVTSFLGRIKRKKLKCQIWPSHSDLSIELLP